jgi:hypothetical protein
VSTVHEAAALLAGKRFINAEFMYKPRPTSPREQIVFDYTLQSRLSSLGSEDAVLFICDSAETIDSLAPFEAQFSKLPMLAIIANPAPADMQFYGRSSPHLLQWDDPDNWQPYLMTDRWTRIDVALEIGSLMESPGYLIMPAHDAVWGHDLLSRLVRFSQRYAKNGLPAAVSPYTYDQHSAVPGADISQDVIDLLNTAFGRDVLFSWKIRFDRVQAFWGKMGMMPFGMCKTVRDMAEKTTWEDDLEIDRVIREAGFAVRCLWINNPQLYRQALPVFDREGVRRVIERTLHYSLKIPDARIGGSTLNFPLDTLGKLRRLISPKFARNNAQAEALIAECCEVIAARLQHFGASWVDWGGYRYVTRIGNPVVEVWRRDLGSSNQSRHSN